MVLGRLAVRPNRAKNNHYTVEFTAISRVRWFAHEPTKILFGKIFSRRGV